MDLEIIEQIMKAMNENGMSRVAIQDENGVAIEIEKKIEAQQVPMQKAEASIMHREMVAPHQAASPALTQAGQAITSPMVGTYYSAPSPEDPPFVKAGDIVKEDTVVCIIEAMKVMNEVKAGKSGKIVEVCVENGNPVEFGTQLFRIQT